MSAKTWHNKILIVNNDYVYRQVSGSHFEQRAINRLSGSAVALWFCLLRLSQVLLCPTTKAALLR